MQSSDEWIKTIGKDGLKEILRFQLQMVTRRTAMGWTPKDLRQALIKQGYTFNPETGSLAWKMSDVQEWCRLLGGKLEITYSGFGKIDMAAFDMIAEAMSSVLDEDSLARFRAVRYLAMARTGLGVTMEQFMKKSGMSRDAIRNWENSTENPMIPGLIRHAKALGGAVALNFEQTEPVKGPSGR